VVLVIGGSTNMNSRDARATAREVGRAIRKTAGVEFRKVLRAGDPLDDESPTLSCFRDQACIVALAEREHADRVLLVSLTRVGGMTKVELALYGWDGVRTIDVSYEGHAELHERMPDVTRELFELEPESESAAMKTVDPGTVEDVARGDEQASLGSERRANGPSSKRVVLWSTGLAAAASLAVGVGYAINSARIHSDPACGDTCAVADPTLEKLRASNRNANIFVGVGLGLAATTALVYWLWDEEPADGGLSVSATPGAATAVWTGRF
jgi:hypothetical protein